MEIRDLTPEWEPTGERIMITGYSGLVGSRISMAVAGRDTAFGLSRGRTEIAQGINLPSFSADLLDYGRIRAIFEKNRPSFVLHLAGATSVDRCQQDREEAKAQNETATENLARICSQLGVVLCFISTDYVFPRTGGPFDENFPPSPVKDFSGKTENIYGATKLAAEKLVVEILSPSQYMIVRIASPYDFAYFQKPGVPPLIYNRLKSGQPIMVVTDARTTYTWVPDIAVCLNRLIKQKSWKSTDPVFHIAGPEILSAEDIVNICLNALEGNTNSQITKTTLDRYFEGKAPRPLEGGLKSIKNLGVKMHSLREVLFSLKDRV